MDLHSLIHELESWPPEQQDALARHLGVLRGHRQPDHAQELRRRLQDSTPEHWLNIEQLQLKLESPNSHYALFIRHEPHDELQNVSAPERQTTLRFIASLLEDPFQDSDYKQIDAEGTTFLVRTLDRFAVYFWVDHAICELRILDVICVETA
ncbi:MAG: hypothetical protein ACI8W8_000123 [Rhodothermales bacterium]|jgi:hypothetical protein